MSLIRNGLSAKLDNIACFGVFNPYKKQNGLFKITKQFKAKNMSCKIGFYFVEYE